MAISGQAITLANSIIGVGILAMPYCFKQCGIILSIVLLLLSGLISRLASHFLLKSAIKSRRRNFEILAFYVFGNPGKFVVEIGIIGFLMGTCIAYFVVVGDLGPQIIAKMLNINQSNVLRTSVMIILSVVCVLPLGLLKDVDSLSNVCAVTIGFYFCLVLKIIGEAASHMLEGDWIDKVEYWQPSGVLQCLPIFSMSLFCQTQLFEIYDTLPNASLEKMNVVTKNAVTICSTVYVLVGFFGYVAFCNQTISGNILTNLSPTTASDVIKMGFVMSLAFSFPLIIFPCRASLYSLLYKKGQVSPYDLLHNMIPDFRFKCLTVSIIGVTLLISLMLPNIELVLGFIGSTIGVMICVIFPAMCFICITIKNTNERMLAQLVLCFGIIIMVLGTYANLQAAEIESIEFNYEAKIQHDSYIGNNEMKLPPPPLNHGNEISSSKPEKKHEVFMELNHINVLKDSSSKKEKVIVKENIPMIKNVVEINLLPELDALNKKDVKIIDNMEKEEVKEIDVKKLDEEKLDDLKKKDLIDTIKRHQEEQRQIMNEQKEILKEMKKTKQEIDKDSLLKKVDNMDISNIEDKKKAVENIQKLAKIAIESLGLDKIDLDSNVNKTIDKRDKDKNIAPKKMMEVVATAKPVHKNHTHKINDLEIPKPIVKAQLKPDKDHLKNLNQTGIVDKLVVKEIKDVKNKTNTVLPIIKSEDNKDKVVTERIGGKRDILEVQTENSLIKDRESI